MTPMTLTLETGDGAVIFPPMGSNELVRRGLCGVCRPDGHGIEPFSRDYFCLAVTADLDPAQTWIHGKNGTRAVFEPRLDVCLHPTKAVVSPALRKATDHDDLTIRTLARFVTANPDHYPTVDEVMRQEGPGKGVFVLLRETFILVTANTGSSVVLTGRDTTHNIGHWQLPNRIVAHLDDPAGCVIAAPDNRRKGQDNPALLCTDAAVLPNGWDLAAGFRRAGINLGEKNPEIRTLTRIPASMLGKGDEKIGHLRLYGRDGRGGEKILLEHRGPVGHMSSETDGSLRPILFMVDQGMTHFSGGSRPRFFDVTSHRELSTVRGRILEKGSTPKRPVLDRLTHHIATQGAWAAFEYL